MKSTPTIHEDPAKCDCQGRGEYVVRHVAFAGYTFTGQIGQIMHARDEVVQCAYHSPLIGSQRITEHDIAMLKECGIA